MSDLTPMLQEMADRADATDMLTPDEIRGVGKRRQRRLVAATATCAVLGTLAAGLLIRGLPRDVGVVNPAGQPSPTASRNSDDLVGIVGPPPPGTPPTGPATGQLVAAATLYSYGAWVYADGRIINVVRNSGTSDQFRGYVVRQLTPSGVEAMRSYLLDGTSGLTRVDKSGGELIVRDNGHLMFARDFDGCGAGHGAAGFTNAVGCPAFTNPEDWLPADAWEDPTFQPFIPHAYEICLGDQTIAILPASAAGVFLASPVRDGLDAGDCRAVATSDARTLVDTLVEAGAVSDASDHNLVVDARTLGGDDFAISPILPDGRMIYCNCG